MVIRTIRLILDITVPVFAALAFCRTTICVLRAFTTEEITVEKLYSLVSSILIDICTIYVFYTIVLPYWVKHISVDYSWTGISCLANAPVTKVSKYHSVTSVTLYLLNQRY